MIFISYSWLNQKPDEKVLKLVNDLRKHGYDAKCDIMDIQQTTSISFPQMMAQNLSSAEKVIIVLSSLYKQKADSFKDGVGDEYRYIITDISKNLNKYILVSFMPLSTQNISDITPDFLSGREIIELSSIPLEASKLLHRLNGLDEYKFSEVNQSKTLPTTSNIDLEDNLNELSDSFNVFYDSTPFFDSRVKSAFPGVRGLKIYDDPKICVDRLEILLRQPLSNSKGVDPIWYFRGSSCLDIPSLMRLSDTKCLIGFNEYEIDKIGVYIDSYYYRNFVYIQTKSDKPSGVYPSEDYYNNLFYQEIGYYHEEFGLYNDIPITRQEYDDGAAVINGKVVQSNGEFKLRVRYLTPYNFVICAKFHPINCNQGDILTKKYLNDILKGYSTIEEFVNASNKLPRHQKDI